MIDKDAKEPISAVIVDDHEIFRAGLRSSLGPEIVVAGEAGSVDEAIALITRVRPQVVLLDVHLPGGSGGGGAEVASAVLRDAECAGTRILALSVSDAADDVVRVIRAGARGYLTKTTSGPDVTKAVVRVHGGDAVFSPRLAGFVLDAFGAGGGETAVEDNELNRLSAREQEVMRLIAQGYTYKEAAQELFLSVRTVETHVSNVLRKLQLSNRHELTAWALSRRIL